jgi:signal transduction histidine kinase
LTARPLLLIALIACACVNSGSKKPVTSPIPTSSDFQKAEYFKDSTDKKDSAFFYFNNVTEKSKDHLLVAMAYAYMAMIQRSAGDFYGAQESALAGMRLVNKDSTRDLYCIASLYNVMGRSNVDLKNFDDAIVYYTLALKLQQNKAYKNIYRNNIAVALREKGNFAEALQMFLSINVDENESKGDYARRITNLASLKWKVDRNFNPVPSLHAALNIRIRENEGFGIIASYNHLLDYYLTSNADSALFYARKMYSLSQKENSTEDQVEALRKLTSLVPLQESRSLFERYEFLSDSIQTARSAAKNQFALIRYESEKSKTENLLLKEDNAQKELQILRQRIFLYGSILLAFLIICCVIWVYRKKRQRVEVKSQVAIRESHLKISQKVHDTVANGLYRIMSEIEHNENIEKEPLLDRIEELYECSRDISYEHEEADKDIKKRIDQILTSFARSNTKISVVGNQQNLWTDISFTIVKELEQILQELMVNMKKHSGAGHVVIHFSRSGHRLEILYKDDGRGFRSNFSKGNGLKSTGNRINQIGGQLIFMDNTAKGAEIKIIVPTNT